MNKLRFTLGWIFWLLGGLIVTLICSVRGYPAEPSIWSRESDQPVLITAPPTTANTINLDADPGLSNRHVRIMPTAGLTRPFRAGGIFNASQSVAKPPLEGSNGLPPVVITQSPLDVGPGVGPYFPPAGCPDDWQPMETDGVVILPEPPNAKDPCNERHAGALQRFELTGTYLPRLNSSRGLGIDEFDALLEIGLPFPTLRSPLLISPESEVRWFEGPTGVADLPAQVYDEQIDFRWFIHIGEHWIADLSATPGIHTDFDNNSRDAFRVPWHAVAVYQKDEDTFFALGIADLDRQDYRLLPVGGVIFSLNSDTKFELVTPRPKISRKINTFGSGGCVHAQDWIYVAAEFGGGEWAIERASGLHDIVDLHDIRAILGLERKNCQGLLSGRVEVGYVFHRRLEYRSDTPDVELSDTLMARAGFWY